MKHIKLIKWSLITLFTLTILALGFIKTVRWFDDNQVVLTFPIQVNIYKPVQVVKRELLRPQIIEAYNELPTIKDLTPVGKMICDTWGVYDCRVALAVAKAESNMKVDAIGINSSSVDIGLFQINSVHLKKPECSLDKIVTAEGNIACAYSIWQDQGWRPWVTFTNGSFKNNL
jgi:hypothetical protein